MIGYVTLGTNDMKRAAAFYEPICVELGAVRIVDTENSIVWRGKSGAELDLTKPFDGKPATVGNGVMAALRCVDSAQVDRVYALAMSMGAKCEGPPGPRPGPPGFYAGYSVTRTAINSTPT